MARGPGAQQQAQLQLLGDAAVRVLARDGLPALTFRTVAAEAGVSPGRVQHYARTSRGLVALTFRRIQELTQRRIHDAVTSAPAASPMDLIAVTLRSLIPCNDQERSLMQVAAAVELHALTDPELAEDLRTGRSALIDFLAEQLGAVTSSAPSPHLLSRAATTLLASAEGLSILTTSGTIDSTHALDLLEESIHAALARTSIKDP